MEYVTSTQWEPWILFSAVPTILLAVGLGWFGSRSTGIEGAAGFCFALVIGAGILMVADNNSIANANDTIIRDTIITNYGAFKVEANEKLAPDTKYFLTLDNKPGETCELNTASTPQDLTVKCGTLETSNGH